jgi:hypothetical protein
MESLHALRGVLRDRIRRFRCQRLVIAAAILVTVSLLLLVAYALSSSARERAAADIETLQRAAERWQALHLGRLHVQPGVEFAGAPCVQIEDLPADRPLVDPWGSPYVIDCLGCLTSIPLARSYGPDRRSDTADDLTPNTIATDSR